MVYPVLAYKETGDMRLYGIKNEKTLRHTSRELLKEGVFNDVFFIDALGRTYKLENVVEAGWANAFGGISIFKKGRQILIDFDLKLIKEETFEEVKRFVLNRLNAYKDNVLNRELSEEIRKSTSLDQIINYFI